MNIVTMMLLMIVSQSINQPPIESMNQLPTDNNSSKKMPLYLLSAVFINVVFYFIISYLNIVQSITLNLLFIALGGVIVAASYRFADRSKLGPDYFTKNEKYKFIFYVSVIPILAPIIMTTILYFKLRTLRPSVAKVIRVIGIKVLLLQIIIPAVFIFLFLFALAHSHINFMTGGL